MTARIPPGIAGAIDYTEIRKDVSYADIERICLEARDHRVASLVVPSALVYRAAAGLTDTDVAVSCYVGYPFGTQAAGVKALEAGVAAEHGAREIEVVPHYGAIRAGRWVNVERELTTVRQAAASATFRIVIEASFLSDGQLSRVASLAADAGYAMIANTAGFRIVSTQPETEAAATPEVVARLARAGGGRIRPKAVGGIGTRADVTRLLHAGAARVGINAAPGLLRRWAEEDG